MNGLMKINRDIEVIDAPGASIEEVSGHTSRGEPVPSLVDFRVYWPQLDTDWNLELEQHFMEAFGQKYPLLMTGEQSEQVLRQMFSDRLNRLKKKRAEYGRQEGESAEQHQARVLEQLGHTQDRQRLNTRRATVRIPGFYIRYTKGCPDFS